MSRKLARVKAREGALVCRAGRELRYDGKRWVETGEACFATGSRPDHYNLISTDGRTISTATQGLSNPRLPYVRFVAGGNDVYLYNSNVKTMIAVVLHTKGNWSVPKNYTCKPKDFTDCPVKQYSRSEIVDEYPA